MVMSSDRDGHLQSAFAHRELYSTPTLFSLTFGDLDRTSHPWTTPPHSSQNSDLQAPLTTAHLAFQADTTQAKICFAHHIPSCTLAPCTSRPLTLVPNHLALVTAIAPLYLLSTRLLLKRPSDSPTRQTTPTISIPKAPVKPIYLSTTYRSAALVCRASATISC